MNLRTLAARIRNCDSGAPAGTTHVFRHIPSDESPNGAGFWEIWTPRGCYPDSLDAPADLDEEDAEAFVTEALNWPVTLVRSTTELQVDAGSEWVTEPIYYVIPNR